MSEKGWVQLENYPTLIAAELAQYKLSQHDIASVILDGEVAGLYSSTLVGGVKLNVSPEDYPAALEVLRSNDSVEEDVVTQEDEITPTSVYCSRCHSKDLQVRDIDDVGRGLSVARRIFKRFQKALGFKKVLRCRNCGNSWTV